MKHEMKLRAIYYEKIKNGEKIYEIRLNDEKRQLIDVGDVIIFKKEPELIEQFNVLVKDMIYFDTFAEMADTLPLKKIGFDKETKSETIDIYHQFYTKDDEKKYGVVAIKVQKL